MNLTGFIRVRLQKRFLRKPVYVLQVEESGEVFFEGDPQYSPSTPQFVTRYRDATAEDLLQIKV